jgi:hypothetical protein
MKEANKDEKLKRSNITLALLLGAIALVGTLIPYFYLNGAIAGGG